MQSYGSRNIHFLYNYNFGFLVRRATKISYLNKLFNYTTQDWTRMHYK